MAGFNPNWIVGKTVARVDMNPFDMSQELPRHMKGFDPVITFTDGSSVTFVTQETGTGEYGTQISYHKPKAT